MADYSQVHDDLKALDQFAVRVQKQPYIEGEMGGFTSAGWNTRRENWLTFAEALSALEDREEVFYKDGMVPVEGIGFLVARSGNGPQVLGGDLDCCRDPETGFISPWATDFLQQVKPFYSEVSPSKCGIRFFSWGKLPGGRDNVFGNGPQGVPEDTRERILDAKPKAREKLTMGKPAFNGLELYESGRHLTLTGERLDDLCFAKEDITATLPQVLAPFLEAAPIKKAPKKQSGGGNRLPSLDIQDVIDTRGFTQEGEQLFGSHPTLGSTTGRNLLVHPAKNVYCWMHNGINAGGDPWVWLACECDAIPWEQAGPGALDNSQVIKKTLLHAVERKLISAQEAGIEIDVFEYNDFYKKDYVEDKKGEVHERMALSLKHAAHTIADKLHLAMVKGDTKTIWRFNGQIYHDDGEQLIRDGLYRIAGDDAHTKESNELINRLHASLSLKPVVFNPDPFLFPAIDGVLDLRTGEMRAGKPEDLMTFTYNAHCHHPGADYDKFLFYLASSLPDLRDCLTAIDLITKAVIRIPFELFVFLLGGGENGKGIFEKVLISLLGMDRVSATKIEEIKRSYFATGNLLGKDAWVITEVETVKEAISIIKAISSGEMLDSDVKYGTGRSKGIPHLLPILDANRALDFEDPSWGRKRRTLKLDFPYEFGYRPDCRPKDPMLLDKLTTPESLAGILQIIKARAPSLIRSRRIYRRKSSEQQEAELDRQRFSLQHFCNDCLITAVDWRENIGPTPAPKLRTDEAYNLYREYCRLWNIPEPAEKVPFGRYINEKYNVGSITSSELVDSKKKTFRYYPGIHCGKSPVTAHAEIYVDYEEIPQTTTDILQIWIGEKDISKENTTDTTDKQTFLDIIRKLQEMYIFVHSCLNPQDIIYEKFLGQKSVVSVVSQKNTPDDIDNSNHRSTTDPISPVVDKPADIEPQINQAPVPSDLHAPQDPGGNSSDLSQDMPTLGKIDRETPSPALVVVRFLQDKETDIDGKPRKFSKEDVASIPAERIEEWAKGGVVEVVQ